MSLIEYYINFRPLAVIFEGVSALISRNDGWSFIYLFMVKLTLFWMICNKRCLNIFGHFKESAKENVMGGLESFRKTNISLYMFLNAGVYIFHFAVLRIQLILMRILDPHWKKMDPDPNPDPDPKHWIKLFENIIKPLPNQMYNTSSYIYHYKLKN